MQVAALDVGTTHTKASLVDPKGRILKAISRPTSELLHPKPGYMEVDAEGAYASVAVALKQLSKHLKNDDLMISLSSMAPVLVLMGKSKAIRPAILYNDLRAPQEVDEWNTRMGMHGLLKINGNRGNIQQWAPKLLWLRNHEPSTIAKARRLFDLSSYLVWRLTGEEYVDYSVAQEGGLLNYSTKAWSDEMLSQLELDRSQLPQLKPTNHYCELSAESRSKLGFRQKRVWITVGCVDAIAAPVALGLLREGGLSIELGSTGIIYAATQTPRPDDRLYLDFSPIDGLYYVGGGTAASGIFYDWMIRLLMNGRLDYNAAARLAAQSNPGSKGLVILPYILGERTPVFDMFARAIIFGLSLETTKADILQGTMEAVAYSLLHNMKAMRENGCRLESGSITGGGAKNPQFRRIICDVLGLPFSYNSHASTTLGAAYIGYMAAGLKKRWEEVEEWMKTDEEIVPNVSLRQTYDLLFSIYLNLYEKHKEDFKMVANI